MNGFQAAGSAPGIPFTIHIDYGTIPGKTIERRENHCAS